MDCDFFTIKTLITSSDQMYKLISTHEVNILLQGTILDLERKVGRCFK